LRLERHERLVKRKKRNNGKRRNKCLNVKKGLKLCEQKSKQGRRKNDDYKWNEKPWNEKSLKLHLHLPQSLNLHRLLLLKRERSLVPHHGNRVALPPFRKLKQILSYERRMPLHHLQLHHRILLIPSSVWQLNNRRRRRPPQQNRLQSPLVLELILMIGILFHLMKKVVTTNLHMQENELWI
jgi:hypothetical protein